MSGYRALLNSAKIFVGPDLTRLRGAGDDYFTISLASDLAAGVGGIQGDTMLVVREQNLYNCSLVLMPASAAIGVLLGLKANTFPFKASYGKFSLVGQAVLVNAGDWAASLGATARTMTLAIAKEGGNTDVGIGEIITV